MASGPCVSYRYFRFVFNPLAPCSSSARSSRFPKLTSLPPFPSPPSDHPKLHSASLTHSIVPLYRNTQQQQNTSLLSPPLSPTPSTIQYLPLSSLSPEPADRFAHLFALRPRWRDRDMMPFLEDLTGERKKLEALVLKFVRKVKVPGPGQGWVEWTSRNQF